MAKVIFVPNPVGQAEVLESPGGPVGRHLLKIGNQLQRYARQDVGKKTFKLERSISVSLSLVSTGLMVSVGSDDPIAYMHHEGTRAHVILPRHASVLKFTSGGKLIYAKRVNHPGTRQNAYLSGNLARAVLG